MHVNRPMPAIRFPKFPFIRKTQVIHNSLGSKSVSESGAPDEKIRASEIYYETENQTMSQRSSNKIVVPEAKAAMEQFKQQAANEVGVSLNRGYNGQLTSREAGSIGGQMVKKMCTVRTASYTRADRNASGHTREVRYIVSVRIS